MPNVSSRLDMSDGSYFSVDASPPLKTANRRKSPRFQRDTVFPFVATALEPKSHFPRSDDSNNFSSSASGAPTCQADEPQSDAPLTTSEHFPDAQKRHPSNIGRLSRCSPDPPHAVQSSPPASSADEGAAPSVVELPRPSRRGPLNDGDQRDSSVGSNGAAASWLTHSLVSSLPCNVATRHPAGCSTAPPCLTPQSSSSGCAEATNRWGNGAALQVSTRVAAPDLVPDALFPVSCPQELDEWSAENHSTLRSFPKSRMCERGQSTTHNSLSNYSMATGSLRSTPRQHLEVDDVDDIVLPFPVPMTDRERDRNLFRHTAVHGLASESPRPSSGRRSVSSLPCFTATRMNPQIMYESDVSSSKTTADDDSWIATSMWDKSKEINLALDQLLQVVDAQGLIQSEGGFDAQLLKRTLREQRDAILNLEALRRKDRTTFEIEIAHARRKCTDAESRMEEMQANFESAGAENVSLSSHIRTLQLEIGSQAERHQHEKRKLQMQLAAAQKAADESADKLREIDIEERLLNLAGAAVAGSDEDGEVAARLAEQLGHFAFPSGGDGPDDIDAALGALRVLGVHLPLNAKEWIEQTRITWEVLSDRVRGVHVAERPTEKTLQQSKNRLEEEKKYVLESLKKLQKEEMKALGRLADAGVKLGESRKEVTQLKESLKLSEVHNAALKQTVDEVEERVEHEREKTRTAEVALEVETQKAAELEKRLNEECGEFEEWKSEQESMAQKLQADIDASHARLAECNEKLAEALNRQQTLEAEAEVARLEGAEAERERETLERELEEALEREASKSGITEKMKAARV